MRGGAIADDAWSIGGGAGGGDADIPPAPGFGFAPMGEGSVELVGVGFEDLTNTRSVTAGTLTVLYWDELQTVGRQCSRRRCRQATRN